MKGNALGSTRNKKRFYSDGQISLFEEKECHCYTEAEVEFPLYNFALQTGRQTVKQPIPFIVHYY